MSIWLEHILNLLENAWRGCYCTNEEYATLKEKIIVHAKNETEEWRRLVGEVQSYSPKKGIYPPGDWIVKTLKHPIEAYHEPDKKQYRTKIIRRTTPVMEKPRKKRYTYSSSETKNQPAYPNYEKTVHNTPYRQPEKAIEPRGSKEIPPEKKQEFIYYFPFPDSKGFFWDDKRTDDEVPSSAYILKIKVENKNSGVYSLLTEKGKIIKNAIINKKAFLHPVCNILEDKGDNKIIVVKEGMLEKRQNKWFPVSGKELKIKII